MATNLADLKTFPDQAPLKRPRLTLTKTVSQPEASTPAKVKVSTTFLIILVSISLVCISQRKRPADAQREEPEPPKKKTRPTPSKITTAKPKLREASEEGEINSETEEESAYEENGDSSDVPATRK